MNSMYNYINLWVEVKWLCIFTVMHITHVQIAILNYEINRIFICLAHMMCSL